MIPTSRWPTASSLRIQTSHHPASAPHGSANGTGDPGRAADRYRPDRRSVNAAARDEDHAFVDHVTSVLGLGEGHVVQAMPSRPCRGKSMSIRLTQTLRL